VVDHLLRQLEPQAVPAREALRRWVDNNAGAIWSPESRKNSVAQATAAWQEASTIQTPFLIVVVIWLGIIFASFGLFAPRNWTVYAVICLSAFSLSTAVFLILELDQPFSGLLHISDAPLKLLLQEIHR